jgi:hypothetical protein
MIQRLCWAKLNGWLLCFWGFIVFDWRYFFSEVSEVRLRQIFGRISQSSLWSVRFQSSSESFYFGKKKHVPMWLVPVIVAYSWLHDFNNIDSLHHCHHIWNGGNGAPRQERCPSGHLARWVSWVPWRYFFGPQSWFSNGFNGFDGKCIGKFMINEGFCENQTILDVLKLIFSFMGSPLYLGIYGECLFYLGGSLSKSKFPWKDKLWMIWGSPIFGWKRWGDQFVINHRWVCPFGVTLV